MRDSTIGGGGVLMPATSGYGDGRLVTQDETRSPHSRSLNRALVMLAAAALGLGCVQLSLVLPGSGEAWWADVLLMVVFWIYVGAGILTWHRRPSNRIGTLIVFGGFMVFAASLSNTGLPGVAAFGTVCDTTVLAVTIHLVLAFPSGRLRGPLPLATVVAAYVASLVLEAPLYVFDPAAPAPLMIADRPDLAVIGQWVQRGAWILIAAATAAIVAQRLKHAVAAHRRVLGPLFAYGMLAVLTIPARSMVIEPMSGLPRVAVATVQLIVFAGVPVAFVLGVLRGGFARSGALEELGARLGAGGSARPALASALARTLGDNSVQIVFWIREQEAWADPLGTLVELPEPMGQRGSVEVELAGHRIGAITYDVALNGDPEVVRAAGRMIAIAAARERPLAELLASRDALLRSRARLVARGDSERRRIARGLHDGIQVQLVLLALEAQQIANASDSAASTTQRATRLRVGIDAAAAALRQLVHDLMPSMLIERGLSAAAEDLIDRTPLLTRLHLNITDRRIPEWVESTAYFLIAEGLGNALKHSQARSLNVRLERAGDRLVVEVRDDGIGGAVLGAGHGLRSVADRVDVAGGRLRVTSESGAGTRLYAELPCAS